MSAEASWSRLGEFLVSRGVVTPDQLDAGLAEQRRTDEPLGQTLVALGFVSEAELADALLEQVAAAVNGRAEEPEQAEEPLEAAGAPEDAPASPPPERRRPRWLRRSRTAPDPELARAVADFERRSAEVERAIAEVRAALRELVPAPDSVAAKRD